MTSRSMSLVALVSLLLTVEGVSGAYRGLAGAPALTIPPGTDIPVAHDTRLLFSLRDPVRIP